ncbi:D-alanyl-D-alanine carboxypeptidase [Streptomyces sp. NPDC101213]|uniref:D-alanyl-D-alanine carboxypeptidase n=1 Tax=Streptomyces sp. NPDC101213 TaxID=3366130 RepID=UPI0037F75210
MAGESPDRSKQRESSAEPTSGSTGAVPEARDPRLAVARDAGNASSASSAASRGGVDTATRVFSVREPVTEEPAEEPAGADGAPAGESPSDAGEGSAARPADGRGPEEPAEAGRAAEGSPEASEDAEEAEDAADAEDADVSATAADGAGGRDDRLRSAVAQWVASADEKPAEEPEGRDEASDEASDEAGESAPRKPSKAAPKWAKGGAEASGSDGGEQPESDAADTDTDAADSDADADEADGNTAPEARTDAGAAESVKAEDPRLGAAAATKPGEPKTDGPKTGTDAHTDTDTDTNADADAADGTRDGDVAQDDESGARAESEAEESDSPVDQPTAVFKAVRPPAGRGVDQPTTMLKLGDVPKAEKPAGAKAPETGSETETETEPETEARAEAGAAPETEAKAEPESAAEAKPEKSPAPEDKAEAKPEKSPGAKPEAGPKPGAPAERASKFVALKPLDDSAGRSVRPAADATAVVPQIGPERTTQQPLPPKPPLDLLAELTNTPPPPPTPLRTLARRVKIWTPLVILLVIAFAIVQAVRPLPATALTLTAKDAYTFEGGKVSLPWPSEGQGAMDVNGIGTMDVFGDQKPVAIGSVAKAMTAYVVLKDHALKSGQEGEKVPVDATAEKEGGYDADGESTLNTVKAGDELTLRQALSAIMIPSANNIARLLARWDAGTEAEFIKKMNDAAEDLGMTNTTYTDASGLKETTVSTAADQVKLGNELVKIPALMEITKLPEWIDPSGQKWRNYNTLVPYNNALGIKTGSTTKAGGNLLFAATEEAGGETVTVVGAVLGQHRSPIIDTVNAVSKTALLAAQDALTSAKILKKGDVVGYVDDRMGNHTPVVVAEDVTAVGWAGLTVKLSFAGGEVPHTAKAGTQVGTLTVGDGSGDAVKVPVSLQRELTEPGLPDRLTRVG